MFKMVYQTRPNYLKGQLLLFGDNKYSKILKCGETRSMFHFQI